MPRNNPPNDPAQDPPKSPKKDPPNTRDLGTEARILDAARRVFVRRGTAGARMQEIAAEAGVTQALVHYYFRTKDALAERVFRDAALRLAVNLQLFADTSRPFESLLTDFVVHYIDVVRQVPFLPGYLLAEAQQHPERLDALVSTVVGITPSTVFARVLEHLDTVIAERVADGRMRPMSARMLLVNVIALCVFPFVARPVLNIAMGLSDDDFADFLDERQRELPTFILQGLRP